MELLLEGIETNGEMGDGTPLPPRTAALTPKLQAEARPLSVAVTPEMRGLGSRADHIAIKPSALAPIHRPIPIMNRFSVSETKPSGTLLLPPTQAHLSSRLSM